MAAQSPAATVPADLTGRVIGAYKIVRKLGTGQWGGVYEALQTSMNRPVALKILSDELAADPSAKQRFIANASAKAKVQHPFILSVYEAGETGGHCFYTHELVDGNNVAEMAARKATVDEAVALHIIRVVSESLSYLNTKKIAHSTLTPKSIYIGRDHRARLSNLANWQNGDTPDTQKEIASLANAVASILPGGRAPSPPMQEMLDKMRAGDGKGFASWGALLQTVKALEPTIVPSDAFRLSEQDEAAIRAVDDAKKKQKRSLVLTLLVSLAILGLILFAIWWQFLRTNERNFDKMVEIPAGEFIYQEGEKVTLPEFWIDQYEVTIGQYQKFLDALAKNPTTQFDHPKQPPDKSHKPINWDTYYGRAKAAKPVKFIPIDLNCPMILVDWWDAYAYAQWVGRRLPTEQEWEKAARGTKGFQFPWGDQFDPKKCNSNADYSDDPRAKGGIDGYNRWSPVDAIPGDRSEFGVIGTAGNVSEWTDSWDSSGKFPVIRGGSYRSPDVNITRRVADLDPERAEEFIGFRTATSDAPKK
ncbi:MAG: SUMF1/EgtB/PvdO family nonheme iron enzyme [Verrucomicrobiota bacterium]|nr:SUMF1/EgtB/PvdO family nonheme iron enzyme [Verrucomicrobiota bacterium]